MEKLHLELIPPGYRPQGRYKGYKSPVPSRNPKYWKRPGRINQGLHECDELCWIQQGALSRAPEGFTQHGMSRERDQRKHHVPPLLPLFGDWRKQRKLQIEGTNIKLLRKVWGVWWFAEGWQLSPMAAELSSGHVSSQNPALGISSTQFLTCSLSKRQLHGVQLMQCPRCPQAPPCLAWEPQELCPCPHCASHGLTQPSQLTQGGAQPRHHRA